VLKLLGFSGGEIDDLRAGGTIAHVLHLETAAEGKR
jgi:hypothetical protein